MRKYDITKLAVLNFIVQIFFIRVYKEKTDNVLTGYGIMYWVVPFTGWWTNYHSLNKRIEFKKIVNVKPK